MYLMTSLRKIMEWWIFPAPPTFDWKQLKQITRHIFMMTILTQTGNPHLAKHIHHHRWRQLKQEIHLMKVMRILYSINYCTHKLKKIVIVRCRIYSTCPRWEMEGNVPECGWGNNRTTRFLSFISRKYVTVSAHIDEYFKKISSET